MGVRVFRRRRRRRTKWTEGSLFCRRRRSWTSPPTGAPGGSISTSSVYPTEVLPVTIAAIPSSLSVAFSEPKVCIYYMPFLFLFFFLVFSGTFPISSCINVYWIRFVCMYDCMWFGTTANHGQKEQPKKPKNQNGSFVSNYETTALVSHLYLILGDPLLYHVVHYPP